MTTKDVLEQATKEYGHPPNEEELVAYLTWPGRKSNNQFHNELQKIINEFDEESQGLVQQQQAYLENAVVNIEGQITNSVINNVFKASNKFEKESEVMTEQEKNEYIKELAIVLGTFYGVLIPLFASSTTASRLKEFGMTTNFKLNSDVKKYIKSISNKTADSHVNTVLEDLRKTSEKAFDIEVKQQLSTLEAAGRKVTDEDLRLARKRALEGASRARITSELTDKYANEISKTRAKAIARTETNRAFTQSQFEADKQFIEQNGLEQRAYKQLVTRSDNPCPICQSLASQPPIPFDKNFASIGDEITATFKDDDGKTRVQKQLVTFEDIGAGNVHVNCSCRYKLIIKGM